MAYGVVSIIIAQLVVFALGLAVYLRQQSQMDVEKHDRVEWGIKISGAVGTADSAKAKVDLIETSHFTALRAKFEAQGLELADCRKEITSLRNEVMQLRTKLASDARQERRTGKQPFEGTAPGNSSNAGEEAAPGLGEAIKNGHAFVFPPQVPPVAPPARKFGQIF